MTKHNYIKPTLLVCLAIIMQACAIPLLSTKKVETHLPDSFNNVPYNVTTSANINWKDFFEDSNLSSLIDVAITNNKEVNILAQRINIAKNEIQARRGEYLPFINFGAGAELVLL